MQLTIPCSSRRRRGEPETSPLRFEPLDPGIVSETIPAFFIGRNKGGFWVAREAKGRIGGLFLLKRSAIAFAHAQGGPAGCATIFPSERFELDLKNEGNPLAGPLAPLLRLATDFESGKLPGTPHSKSQSP